MADADDWGALIGAVIGLMVVVTLVVVAVMSLMSVGVVFGSGVSLMNYYQAFRHNVQPERATP